MTNQKVDLFERNVQWASRWGSTFDPKSVQIVYVSKDELQNSVRDSQRLPIGSGAGRIIQDNMRLFWKLREAIHKGKIDELLADEEEDQSSTILSKSNSSEILSRIEKARADEKKYLDENESNESCAPDPCRVCKSDRTPNKWGKLVCVNHSCTTRKCELCASPNASQDNGKVLCSNCRAEAEKVG